jgi:glyoxylate reductase
MDASLSKPRVFVTGRLPEEALNPLRDVAEVKVWNDALPPPRDVLLYEASQSDGLITMLTARIDSEALTIASRLRIIANVAVGYDNIDLAEATRHGVVVTNTPGILTETTADLAFALMLAAARNIAFSDRYVREGNWRIWDFNLFLGQDVHDATLGIVGLGRIGIAMARRARGFGMRCLYHSRTRRPDDERRYELEYATLDEILRTCDFVSLHVPLTDDTQRLIGKRELALMKPTAILINTSRGPVVDSEALYEALRERRIAGAGLDVTDPEPLPIDSPLLELDNLVVTPHIGSASLATRGRMAEMAVTNVLAAFRGKTPPNCINPEVLPTWQKLMSTYKPQQERDD